MRMTKNSSTTYPIPSLLSLSADVVATVIEEDPFCYKDILSNTQDFQPLLPYIFNSCNISEFTLYKFLEKGYFTDLLTEEFFEYKKLIPFKQVSMFRQMLKTSKKAIKVSEACKTYCLYETND